MNSGDPGSVPCDCGHTSAEHTDCKNCLRRLCPDCYAKHLDPLEAPIARDKFGNEEAVELQEALMWQCPKCGHSNSMLLIRQNLAKASLTDQEELLLRKQLGIEVWEEWPSEDELEGSLIALPGTVLCAHCRLTFATLPPPLLAGDIDLSDDSEEDDLDDADEEDDDKWNISYNTDDDED